MPNDCQKTSAPTFRTLREVPLASGYFLIGLSVLALWMGESLEFLSVPGVEGVQLFVVGLTIVCGGLWQVGLTRLRNSGALRTRASLVDELVLLGTGLAAAFGFFEVVRWDDQQLIASRLMLFTVGPLVALLSWQVGEAERRGHDAGYWTSQWVTLVAVGLLGCAMIWVGLEVFDDVLPNSHDDEVEAWWMVSGAVALLYWVLYTFDSPPARFVWWRPRRWLLAASGGAVLLILSAIALIAVEAESPAAALVCSVVGLLLTNLESTKESSTPMALVAIGFAVCAIAATIVGLRDSTRLFALLGPLGVATAAVHIQTAVTNLWSPRATAATGYFVIAGSMFCAALMPVDLIL